MIRLSSIALAVCFAGCSSAHVGSGDGGVPVDARDLADVAPRDDGGPAPDDAARRDGGRRDDGGDASIAAQCGTATPAFAGALCGSTALPCEVRVEVVQASAHFRNDAPAIAVPPGGGDPTILLAVAEGPYAGYLASRDASGSWSLATMPFAYATGSAIFTPEGDLVVATEDGAYGHHLRVWDGAAWSLLDTIPTTQAVFAGGLARDDLGCLHTAHWPSTARDGPSGALHLVRGADGGWRSEAFGTGSTPNLAAALALAPSGAAHLAWNEWIAGEAATASASSAMPAWERAVSVTTGQSVEIGVIGAAGGEEAHVMASGGGIHHAVRRAAGWTTRTLALDVDEGSCSGSPVDGASCDQHTIRHAALAIATSATDVRLIWSRVESSYRAIGRCDGGPGGPGGGGGPPPPPPFECRWEETARTDANSIEIADPTASPATVTTVATGLGGHAGTAAVGADGAIHLALYDLERGTIGSVVRYVRLAP